MANNCPSEEISKEEKEIIGMKQDIKKMCKLCATPVFGRLMSEWGKFVCDDVGCPLWKWSAYKVFPRGIN